MRSKIFIICIILVFFIQIFYIFFLGFGIDKSPTSDGKQYDNIAIHILNEHKFILDSPPSRSFRPPLYPFFLAGIYLIFGHDFIVVRLIHVLLLSFSSIIVFCICNLLFNKKIGIISVVIFALYPMFGLYAALIQTETLFIFLTCLSFYICLLAINKESLLFFMLAGFAVGVTALCRPNILFIFPFLFCIYIIFYFKEKLKVSILYAFIFSLSLIFTLVPWTYRNYTIHGKIISIATATGINLYGGYNPNITSKYLHVSQNPSIDKSAPNFKRFIGPVIVPDSLNEVELNSFYINSYINYVKSDPLRFLKVSLFKFLWFWHLHPYQHINIPETKDELLFRIMFYPILILFILGLYISFIRKRIRHTFLLISIIFNFVILQSIAYVDGRYRLPVIPFVIIFAAYSIYYLNNKYKYFFRRR